MTNFTYDKDSDAAYIRLKDTRIVKTDVVIPGQIMVDKDKYGDTVGVEIIGLKALIKQAKEKKNKN